MEIKLDPRNYRKHDQKNKDLINKSLKECGAGRSIVIDNEDNIIAGNGIYQQAQKLGLKTKVIETDGSELVVVKRTDLATEDEKRKQLAIMDNSTSDNSEFDLDLLKEDFENDILLDFGISLDNSILENDKEISESDVGLDYHEKYAIYIECKNELEQEEIYYKLTEMGIKCQVKTL